jgi:hypothetical protein
MSNILEAAKQTLEPGDEVLHRYPVTYEGREGQLLLSNKKIIFVIRKGAFRPHYEPFIEIAYDTITSITPVASHALELVAHDTVYRFVSFGAITSRLIVGEITDIKEHN